MSVRWGFYDGWALAGMTLAWLGLIGSLAVPVEDARKLAVSRRSWIVGGMLLIFLGLGIRTIRNLPAPAIDVWHHQQAGCAALLRGENPYAITVPSVYPDDTSFYAAGVQKNGVVGFGMHYPPVSLLWVLPGYLLFGDVRYSMLLAMLVSGACMGLMTRCWAGIVAAGIYLLSPTTLFVLEQAWTEPIGVMLLAAVAMWRRKHPIGDRKLKSPFSSPRSSISSLGVGITLGAFFAFKQYAPLLLPLLWLVRPGKRTIFIAAATGLIVSLPFVMWSPSAFWHSAIETHLNSPFRVDALSWLVAYARYFGSPPPQWVGFVIFFLMLILCLWRAPRSVAGFSLSIAVCLLGFFLFGKQAFCNYFHLVLGAVCVAIASADSHDRPQDPVEQT